MTLRAFIPIEGAEPCVPESFRRTVTDLTQNRAKLEEEDTVFYAEAEGRAVLI